MTARRSTVRFPAAQGWIPRGWNGVRSARVWKRLLGVEHTVVEEVVFDEEAEGVVAMVPPTRSRRRRRAGCQRRGRGAALPGGGRAPGSLPCPWGGGRRGAVGAAWRLVHPGV